MGLRVAVQSGNWSSGSTWNGGVLPTTGDVVASNTYTVTIDQNVNVDSITNTAQSIVNAIPVMTGYTTPSGVVSASYIDPTYPPWGLFDTNVNTEWRFSSPAWVSYEFPTPKALDRYYFTGYTTINSWSFDAWDGVSWNILHSTSSAGVTAYTSPLIGNSSSYSKYRLNITNAVAGARLHTLNAYEYLATSNATAGGGFILSDGSTLTCTNTSVGITNQVGITCLTVNNSGTSTVNSHIRATDGSSIPCILKNGTGTFNVNGNLAGRTSTNNLGSAVSITNTGTVNIVGNIFSPAGQSGTVVVSTGSILNIVGNIFCGTVNAPIGGVAIVAPNATVNITGNLIVETVGTAGWTVRCVTTNASNTTLNIIGNIDATSAISTTHQGLFVNASNCSVYHTGNLIGSSTGVLGGLPLSTTSNIYYNQVGYIQASQNGAALSSTATNAIHILTGPFISSTYGVLPIYVTRMHYFRTSGSYFEFRDNGTDGALSPGAIASASRLVSPNTVIDAPSPSNVRFGTTYASGSMTGTMRVPASQNVQYGVLVDNTVGTATLQPSDIWNTALTSISASNSIGVRIKNAATVETVGAQLQSLLNG